ncbi:hypothetical protein [Baaleninema simplex]|uniref:hypothetical protein n=1 Tax=Baaleninema simplex TaxID=2862350 RepID=UPI0003666EF8|nr:hypothetical protein [Baaleninema simplex]
MMSKKCLVWSEVWMFAVFDSSGIDQLSLLVLAGFDNNEVEIYDPRLPEENRVSHSFKNYEKAKHWLLENHYKLLDEREDLY